MLGRRAPAAVLVADSSHLLVGDDEADNTAIRRAVRNAIDEGFAGAVSVNAEGLVDGWVALPDPIAATIDLAALRADYEGWFAAAG